MKTKLIYGWIGICVLAAGLLAGCTTEQFPEETKSTGGFTITATDYIAHWSEGGSRSLEPLSDELQKQIHNIYYFFYDKNGYIEYIYYQDITPAAMSVEVTFDDFKLEDDKTSLTPEGTVYLVVNSQKMDYPEALAEPGPHLVSSEKVTVGDAIAWRQSVYTVHEFQKKGLFPLYLQTGDTPLEGTQGGDWSVGRPDHFIMYGLFDGTLDKEKNFQILLGRIAVRMRLAITGAGLGQQARITIQNAPKYTSLFPLVTPLPRQDSSGGSEYWTMFSELIDTGDASDNGMDGSVGTDRMYGGITGTANNYSASMFYYCGENRDPDDDERTTLIIETWDDYVATRNVERGSDGTDTPDRTYELELGNEGPNEDDWGTDGKRNYSLLRNTSYTFNLVLNSAASASNAKARSSDGSYQLYPIGEKQ